MNLTGIDIHSKYWDKVTSLREQIQHLEEKREKFFEKMDFAKTVLKPFAKSLIPAIEKKYGKKVVKKVNQHQTDLDFYGPFGLRCERSVIWKFTDGTEAWLHIAQQGKSFSVDTGKSDSEYPQGSIGNMNGFGKKSIAIEKLSEEQVISYTSLYEEDK